METREQLITQHADSAKRIASRMARRCPSWIAREDLIAAGMIGLIEAADRYDATREEPFLAFAEHRIRGAVLDELRRGDMMPRRHRQMARKVVAVVRRLEAETGDASDDKVASALGVSVEIYRDRLAGLLHVDVESLDGTGAMEVVDLSPTVDTIADQRRTLDRVRAALELLPKRDVQLLALYYLEELTYQQIGAIHNISPSRVCQLVGRALGRIRDTLGLDRRLAA